MTTQDQEIKTKAVFDPLDMHNYRIEKLPKRQKGGVEKMAGHYWPHSRGSSIYFICFCH